MKNLISFILGIIGTVLLTVNFLYHLGGPPSAYPTNSLESFKLFIYSFSFLLGIIEFAPFFIFFTSFFGFWLGLSGLKSSTSRKLAFLGIIFNSINLLLSLFIAWLLFGLARGM